MKRFLFYFCLLVFFIFLAVMAGCGGGKDDSHSGINGSPSGSSSSAHGNCSVCNGDIKKSDCDSGYWCSPFIESSNRCVPNSIRQQDPYTCIVFFEGQQNASGMQPQGAFQKQTN